MSKEQLTSEAKMTKKRKPEEGEARRRHTPEPGTDSGGLAGLQQLVGNQAVQRLLVQRSAPGPAALDDETADRINRERSGGEPLDGAVQDQIGATMGHDFGGVQVHTSPEADDLNRQLSAKAFTTGQDIFFREGAYQPHTSGGQELIAHELTHVVQQGAGRVQGGGRMTVNQPGDAFEHEADAVAKTVTGPGTQVQRQAAEEEEEVQTQAAEEEEEVQMQAEEEEEEVQTQEADEEEEVQMQEMPEEEEALA